MAFKFNVKCAKCGERYLADVASDPGTYTVRCPRCSEPYSVSVNEAAHGNNKTKRTPVVGSAAIALKVKRCELFSGIAWLVVGVLQIALLYTAAAGVWNIINAIMRLRSAANVSAGNAAVVPYFDQRKVWLIVMAVVNLVLGGVVGVFLVAFDWYVRDFVLRNRSAFE